MGVASLWGLAYDETLTGFWKFEAIQVAAWNFPGEPRNFLRSDLGAVFAESLRMKIGILCLFTMNTAPALEISH